MNEMAKWVGIVFALLGAAISYGANDQKIKQLEKDMEDQEAVREQQIRMEERQKVIQQDIQKILDKLDK